MHLRSALLIGRLGEPAVAAPVTRWLRSNHAVDRIDRVCVPNGTWDRLPADAAARGALLERLLPVVPALSAGPVVVAVVGHARPEEGQRAVWRERHRVRRIARHVRQWFPEPRVVSFWLADAWSTGALADLEPVLGAGAGRAGAGSA